MKNPKFARRHYVAIANALKDCGADASLVNQFVVVFGRDNPRFDRNRFIKACTPDPIYEVTPTGVAMLKSVPRIGRAS